MTDWRLDQTAAKFAAVDLTRHFSADLMHRIGEANAELFVIGSTLLIKVREKRDVQQFASYVARDIKNEIKSKRLRQIAELEIWHRQTDEKRIIPVEIS